MAVNVPFLPTGIEVFRWRDKKDAASVLGFASDSPDCTIYHSEAYLQFCARENGQADLLLFRSGGADLFALPWHVQTGSRITTGYSGACFPAGVGDSKLRRSIEALGAVIDANRNAKVTIMQAVVARAYEDPKRAALLASLFDSLRGGGTPLYSRVLDLSSSLDGDDLRPYDPDVRNQIRQATRRGVTADVLTPDTPAAAARAYRLYHALHQESWKRTGLRPHSLEYWLGLNEAIVAGGGTDLMVVGRTRSGEPVGAVTFHIFQGRALYWSGCSRSEGLPLRVNPFCLHSAIAASRELGATACELGRFSAVENDLKERAVTQYKSQFGGQLVRVANVAPKSLVDVRARLRRLRNSRSIATKFVRRSGLRTRTGREAEHHDMMAPWSR